MPTPRLSDEARAVLADGLGEHLFAGIVHLRRYRYAYAVVAVWLAVTLPLKPADRGATRPAPTPAAVLSLPDAPAQPAATASDSANTPADGSAVAPSSGSPLYPAPPDSALSTVIDSGATSVGNGEVTPEPTGAPAAPPASSSPAPTGSGGCTADSGLPVPVATTVVAALATGQTTVSQTAGQPPPADAAGTVGGAAGCPTAQPEASGATRSGSLPAWLSTWPLLIMG